MLPEFVWHQWQFADDAEQFAPGAEIRLSGLHGAARALAIAAWVGGTRRPFLVVARSDEAAAGLAQDLRFFLGEERVALLPEREADPETRAGRVDTLHRFSIAAVSVVVASVPAALLRTLPPGQLAQAVLSLYPQRSVAREAVIQALTAGGYRSVGQVSEPGEYATRGGILDCFPPNERQPVRVEFFGDEVHSLRRFDPETQRSLGPADRVTILPLQEYLLTEEAAGRLSTRLRTRALRAAVGLSPVLVEALEQRRSMPEWDVFLPDLLTETESLLAYLPADGVVVWDEPAALTERAATLGEEIAAEREHEPDLAPLFPPAEERWTDWERFQEAGQQHAVLRLEAFSGPPREGGAPSREMTSTSATVHRGRITTFLEELDGWRRQLDRIVLVARSEAQGRRLQEILRDHDLGARLGREVPEPGGMALWVGELTAGFGLPELGLHVVTEQEIFGAHALPRRRTRPKEALPFTSFADLKVGDYVVHVDHGIAQYRGLEQILIGGDAGDFLHLEYADRATLYVPVSKFHLVQRYVAGESATPALDRLGGTSWAKAKERVRASVREMAGELLRLYAARQVVEGHAFSSDSPWQKEFEAAFPYDETPDQLQAIADVRRDMERPHPMDRLVCGDVGYGKTEVALRAAFKAIMDGKQAAVLVPTTVLAMQHHQTFSARFANFPAKIELLCRFRPAAEQRAAIKGIEDGTVDIVIGTHRLLQKDVRFRSLGLLVVDEEQRFGVAAKEALKQFKREVDVLTLTATPIPRTLHMTMLGVRDVSTIETPPEERLAIRTYVTPFEPDVVTEAIQREMARGGQVFFVHNRVESIHTMARRLKQLVPEARIGVAHGQQSDAALEKIMVDFYLKKVDVLLCTTIIESGLDVPSANTILIDRADTLGLAQLYQLRGRVGRDKYRAYAYLLIPADGGLSEVARKRLQVIAELTELGSGFKIAARDLEIRGAGNLLGAEQSGHIAAVGYDLYTQLIQDTIRELKGEPGEERLETTVRLTDGFIPEPYVSDAALRLNLYKRLTAVKDQRQLAEFSAELADRFGPIPAEAAWLLEVVSLKLEAQALRIQEIDARADAIRVRFGPNPPVAPETILALLRSERGRLKYLPEDTLEYRSDGPSTSARLETTRKLLQRLTAGVTVSR